MHNAKRLHIHSVPLVVFTVAVTVATAVAVTSLAGPDARLPSVVLAAVQPVVEVKASEYALVGFAVPSQLATELSEATPLLGNVGGFKAASASAPSSIEPKKWDAFDSPLEGKSPELSGLANAGSLVFTQLTPDHSADRR